MAGVSFKAFCEVGILGAETGVWVVIDQLQHIAHLEELGGLPDPGVTGALRLECNLALSPDVLRL